MTERTEVRNNYTPEGLYKLKDDVEHVCVETPRFKCATLHWSGFRYKAVPSQDMVDYLAEKGFPDLDFTIDRI